MKKPIAYIAIVSLVFLGFVVVFSTFPRTTVSELEKRELAHFPSFSWQRLADGSFTRDVSAWFSDSEPFRDELMALSMEIKDLIALTPTEESVRFHASDAQQSAPEPLPLTDSVPQKQDKDLTAQNAKIANAGIIIVGKGPNVRALMAFGASAPGGQSYAQAINRYRAVFGSGVNIYCMVIPTAIEFYCPEKVRKRANRQLPTIQNIHAHLAAGVKPVDVYTPLSEHTDEDIYLRTDHHWSPLGGYYAAREFARVAGVPFRDLSAYERHVVPGYVGSMYGYSQDVAVKNAPEDFVYYTPTGITYSTTYINYIIDEHYQVTGESGPVRGPFFYKLRGGGAYCIMMGADTKITQVRTSTKNGRRVIILKDSFGNMLPGYLFYSFEEVHVIDSRYFTKDIVTYAEDNQITDILFANNIFMAYAGAVSGSYVRFLHQRWTRPKEEAPESAADSTTETTVPRPHLEEPADSLAVRDTLFH